MSLPPDPRAARLLAARWCIAADAPEADRFTVLTRRVPKRGMALPAASLGVSSQAGESPMSTPDPPRYVPGMPTEGQAPRLRIPLKRATVWYAEGREVDVMDATAIALCLFTAL